MIIKVLGSSAGGGFPQWNCNGANSASVRQGKPGFTARTQSSIAASAKDGAWVLFNASPDLREQISANSELWPHPDKGKRNSPIHAAVLTNGDVDHVAGLLNLREMQAFTVYGTERVLQTLAANSIFNVLNADLVPRRTITLDEPFDVVGPDGDMGLRVEAFAVPGKVALYLEDESAGPSFGSQEGDTIGVKITEKSSGQSLFYIPGCADVDEALAARIKGAEVVLFDGTLYTDDEMLKQGLMPKTGARMGHISISGPDGSISAFQSLDVKRKIYVHINNSNPVLNENSEERRAAESAGWEIGYDGMEVRL